MEYTKSANSLIEAVKKSTCAYTTVRYAMEQLEADGFKEIELGKEWQLEKGSKYMVNIHDSSLIAFAVGNTGRLKVGCAHTDHPCLYVKPEPELVTDGIYGRLNTEIYGGPILNTWLDRPLSIAGRVALRSDNIYEPDIKIIDMERPILTIPNLAIHLNREVNKGIELNRQSDMIPLLCLMEGDSEEDNPGKDYFRELLQDYLMVDKADILDYELYVYNTDEPQQMGLNGEFISGPRLDNITSVNTLVKAIGQCDTKEDIKVIALFDNEEVGSRTKQGADSQTLAMVLEKLYMSLGYSREEYIDYISEGMMISLDVAHGHHPNRPEKSDPTNKCMLGKGIVIKRAASQTYATDCAMTAIIQQLCQKHGIPCQKYAVRSDGTTGSTLGTIAGKYLPMRSIDIGVPVLAMHSARELMGTKDQYYLDKLLVGFFA